MAREEPRVMIITCNWNAYQSLDEAGRQHLAFPPGARHLKVECMGQIGPSLILKAFEKGADGVILVGCAPEECYFQFGSRRAAELFEETRKLAGLLGLEDRIHFYQMSAGEGAELVARVHRLVERLATGDRGSIVRQRPRAKGEGATAL